MSSPRRFGPYELERELARGGMGVVYAARHTETGVTHALKTIQFSAGALDADDLARFRREGELLSRLDHPGIVRVHSAGVQDGVAYLVQALLPGGSLQARLRRSGPLPWEEAVALVAELADAIAYAHTQGTLHRDLKPDNVLFDDQGRPVLVDFGLGRDLGTESRRMTETGQVMGTPGYMAPEQVEGTRGDDPRTDVYGLGALLFALIAGRPPFTGQGLAILAQIVHDRPPDLGALVPDTPRHVAATVACCLSKRLEDRFASAVDLARSLRSREAPARRWRSRVPWWVAALVVLAVTVAVLFVTGTPSQSVPAVGVSSSASVTTVPGPAPSAAPSADSNWKRALRELRTNPVGAEKLIRAAEGKPNSREAERLLARVDRLAADLGQLASSSFGSSALTPEQRQDWLACIRIHRHVTRRTDPARLGVPLPSSMLNGLSPMIAVLAGDALSKKERSLFVGDVMQALDPQDVPGFAPAVLDFVRQLDHAGRQEWLERCTLLARRVARTRSGEWIKTRVKLVLLLDGFDPPALRVQSRSRARAMLMVQTCGMLLGKRLTLEQRAQVRLVRAKGYLRCGEFEDALKTARLVWESPRRDRRAQGVMAIALHALERRDEALATSRDFLVSFGGERGQMLNTIVLGILWELDTPANVAPELRKLVRENPELYGWRLREVLVALELEGPHRASELLTLLKGWIQTETIRERDRERVLGLPDVLASTILGLPDVRRNTQPLRVLVDHYDHKRRVLGGGTP